jgi:hypothetical protein
MSPATTSTSGFVIASWSSTAAFHPDASARAVDDLPDPGAPVRTTTHGVGSTRRSVVADRALDIDDMGAPCSSRPHDNDDIVDGGRR